MQSDNVNSIENQNWYEYFKNLNCDICSGQANISQELADMEKDI